MNKVLKFGVIGLGFGASVHVPALKSIKGVKIVAVAGRDLEKAKAIASELKIPAAFDNLDDFFKQKLDAVTIALPPDQAEEAIRTALRYKLPVLVEKPLTNSCKSAKSLAKLAEGKITAIDFQFSELDVFKKLKELIDRKRFGNVRSVQISWMVESQAHREKKWSWKVDKKRGGGVISLLGSHMFYLIEWFFGPVSGLFASISSKSTCLFSSKGTYPAEDLVSIVFDHPKISKIAATISNSSPFGIGHRWEIVFDFATVILHNPTFDYMNGFVLKIRKSEYEKITLMQKEIKNIDGRIKPFRSLVQRFIEAIRNKKRFTPDFYNGTRVQKLMEVCYKSARENRYIKI